MLPGVGHAASKEMTNQQDHIGTSFRDVDRLANIGCQFPRYLAYIIARIGE